MVNEHDTPVSIVADRCQVKRLLDFAQQMGGPLYAVLGRMEFLLERGTDDETTRSLKAGVSRAHQLVVLRRQLLAEACIPWGRRSCSPN